MKCVYLSVFVALWTIAAFSANSIADEAEEQGSRPDEDSRRLLDEYGDYQRVDIFDKDRDRLQAGSGVTLDHVLRAAAKFIGRPIYNQVARSPEDRIVWRWSARRYREIREKGDVDEAAVLDCLAKQTGLAFEKETRRVRVLLVERDALNEDNEQQP